MESPTATVAFSGALPYDAYPYGLRSHWTCVARGRTSHANVRRDLRRPLLAPVPAVPRTSTQSEPGGADATGSWCRPWTTERRPGSTDSVGTGRVSTQPPERLCGQPHRKFRGARSSTRAGVVGHRCHRHRGTECRHRPARYSAAKRASRALCPAALSARTRGRRRLAWRRRHHARRRSTWLPATRRPDVRRSMDNADAIVSSGAAILSEPDDRTAQGIADAVSRLLSEPRSVTHPVRVAEEIARNANRRRSCHHDRGSGMSRSHMSVSRHRRTATPLPTCWQ